MTIENIVNEELPLLRKCKVCGLEAYTPMELDDFVTYARSRYWKRNLCKRCFNLQQAQWSRERAARSE